jgi:hypothetical protein
MNTPFRAASLAGVVCRLIAFTGRRLETLSPVHAQLCRAQITNVGKSDFRPLDGGIMAVSPQDWGKAGNDLECVTSPPEKCVKSIWD